MVRHDGARPGDAAGPRPGPASDASDWWTGGSAAGSITSSATTIACGCSPRGSAKGVHEFTYIVRATTAGTFRRRRRAPKRCTSRKCSGGRATSVIESSVTRAGRATRDTKRFGPPSRSVLRRGWCSTAALADRRWCCRAAAWLRCGPLPPACSTRADAARRSSSIRNGARALRSAARATAPRDATDRRRASRRALVAATTRRRGSALLTRTSGVDPIAIARAAGATSPRGAIVEGGSTITQQVAKLLLNRQSARASTRGVAAQRSRGGGRAAPGASLRKREILALYLNLAPYGNQIAGVERASRAYFGVDARRC